MYFRPTARSSSSVWRPRGIPCVASCGSLNARAAVIGPPVAGPFPASLDYLRAAAQNEPGFERNAMDAHPQAFSLKFLDTKRHSRQLGRDHPVPSGGGGDIWSDDSRSPNYNRHITIDPKNPPTHQKMRLGDFANLIGSSRFATIPIRRCLAGHTRDFFSYPAGCEMGDHTTQLRTIWRKLITWLRAKRHPCGHIIASRRDKKWRPEPAPDTFRQPPQRSEPVDC